MLHPSPVSRLRMAVAITTVSLVAACSTAAPTAAPPAAPTAAATPEPTTAATATAAPSAGGEPIIIGHALAQNGFMSAFDLGFHDGAQLAVTEINAAGGVLGRPLKINTCDTNTDIAQSAPCAQRLLADGAEFMLATTDYDFGGPAIRTAVQAGKVGIGFAGDPLFGYHGLGALAFNLSPGSAAEGAVIAEFANEMGWKKGYSLTDTVNSFFVNISKHFKTRFTALGGQLAGEDTFVQTDASVATQVSRIKAANPDFILVSSFPPGGASAVKQIRAAGITAPILGNDAFDGTYWLGSIPGLSNMYNPKLASADGNDPIAEANTFFVNYEKATGKKPDLPTYAAAGYVAVKMWASAAQKAGTIEGTKVAEVIGGLTGFPSVIGNYTYASRPQCNIPQGLDFKWFQVQNGVETFVKSLAPKEVPAYTC
jgi:branched-chain amino acid transport system substrate-binding protein